MSVPQSIVVVHGLWNGASMELFRRRLAPQGFRLHVFRYPSVTDDLAANAARLARFLDALPGESVHLLGHSLGGVLIREMLERHAAPRPGRVVCLGSPFLGSQIAARVSRVRAGRWLIGRSLSDLNARGAFGRWRAPLELGIIAGGRSLGAGTLLGGFDEPNDGTVAVAETRLEGATDHIVLPVSHFSMLWSRLVLEQIRAFLELGKFRRAAASALP